MIEIDDVQIQPGLELIPHKKMSIGFGSHLGTPTCVIWHHSGGLCGHVKSISTKVFLERPSFFRLLTTLWQSKMPCQKITPFKCQFKGMLSIPITGVTHFWHHHGGAAGARRRDPAMFPWWAACPREHSWGHHGRVHQQNWDVSYSWWWMVVNND